MFQLRDRVLYLGRPAEVRGKTYLAEPLYDLCLDDGFEARDVPQSRLAPADVPAPPANP